jgi:DNA/RNA-binding domain of Phe-tRNA-synthetase-like protein
MALQLHTDIKLSTKYPGLRALTSSIQGVTVRTTSPALGDLKRSVEEETRSKYSLETLKDVAILRAYRDFFWRIGIDPTKVRPAAEALIRRVLGGRPLPTINSLVDAYNLASVRRCIAIAAFDQHKLRGQLMMREARSREHFLGFGMENPMVLNGGEVVVTDEEKLIAVYPYRDADISKVTEGTVNVLLMSCGCPGIENEQLIHAERTATDLVLQFCGRTP